MVVPACIAASVPVTQQVVRIQEDEPSGAIRGVGAPDFGLVAEPYRLGVPHPHALEQVVHHNDAAECGERRDKQPVIAPGDNAGDGAGCESSEPVCDQPLTSWHRIVRLFVPRPLDFHPDAVPCPYPHTSVDVDEVIFYCRGRFTSRRGIAAGSISHHPAGIPHGPHAGAYEGSIGEHSTEELAVMLDCYAPLSRTKAAAQIEDEAYHESFGPARV